MLVGIFDLVWLVLEVIYSFFKFLYNTYKENKKK